MLAGIAVGFCQQLSVNFCGVMQPPKDFEVAELEPSIRVWNALEHSKTKVPKLPNSAGLPVKLKQNFLSPEEIQELLALVETKWQSSPNAGTRTATGEQAVRTSYSAMLPDDHPVVHRLQERVGAEFNLTADHCEAAQIVRYSGSGQKYSLHVDWGTAQETSVRFFGQRVASALIYLKGVPAGVGGETRFPHMNLAFRPVAGAAVFWPNVGPDGVPLHGSEHEAMPMTDEGIEKCAVNVWLREKPLPIRGGSLDQGILSGRLVGKEAPINRFGFDWLFG